MALMVRVNKLQVNALGSTPRGPLELDDSEQGGEG